MCSSSLAWLSGNRFSFADAVFSSRAFGAGRCKPLQQVIPNAECIGHDGQRRIDSRTRGEEATVHDVEIVEVVRLAVHVKRRSLRVGPEADRTVLVGYAGERNTLTDVKIPAKQPVMAVSAVDRATVVLQSLLQMPLEFVMSLLIVGRVAQNDLPITIDRHPIVRIR